MHDIGKVAIPDEVLNKPGKLTDEQFALMQSHTVIGYKLLSKSKRRILQAAAIVAHEHHEKWNGKGYPRGLKEEEIHIYGRITAVADVFDALGSDRVYRKRGNWTGSSTCSKRSAAAISIKLVDVMLDILPEMLEVRDKYSDTVLNSATD